MAEDIVRKQVKDYFTLDKEIKESETLLKKIKKQRKEIGDDILKWLQENGRSRIKTGDGILERSTTARQITVNAQWVHEKMIELTGDDEQAANLCKMVFEQRPSKETEILKTGKDAKRKAGEAAE